MQCGGLGQRAGAALEQISDALAAERIEGAGVVEGAGGGLGAVDFAERDDFVDVVSCMESSELELLVIALGTGG